MVATAGDDRFYRCLSGHQSRRHSPIPSAAQRVYPHIDAHKILPISISTIR